LPPSAGISSLAKIDLIFLGQGKAPAWSLGEIYQVPPTVKTLSTWIDEHLLTTEADAWLFWDSRCGVPNVEQIKHVFTLPGHIWHAGLKLGNSNQPGILDFVHPTWMLNCPTDPDVEITSWRLSLSAALICTDVIRQMGNLNTKFDTLVGAALELGYRYTKHGVIVRYIPTMIEFQFSGTVEPLSFADELRLLHNHMAYIWILWSLFRVVLTGYISLQSAILAFIKISSEKCATKLNSYHTIASTLPIDFEHSRVAVLIPTVDRYPYLYTLLDQLRYQTIPPSEVIVVDQTDQKFRNVDLIRDFSDLPLKIFYLDTPGQCHSRNLGLEHITADYVLFLDDDDEIFAELIKTHLTILHNYRADVSSGVVYEPGQTSAQVQRDILRVSDVFPTNNTMIRRKVLCRSGMFDLAYDQLARADGDLGMRIYLSGSLMVLDENHPILHHHAPQGGLRKHKARTVTRLSSRRNLMHRNLLSVSDLYLMHRYFSPRQMNEVIWINMLATLSGVGKITRIGKFIIGLFLLPNTIYRLGKQRQASKKMLQQYPQIPSLTDC
jgi:glycosyltransferase involved in cell wall biosynthesis